MDLPVIALPKAGQAWGFFSAALRIMLRLD